MTLLRGGERVPKSNKLPSKKMESSKKSDRREKQERAGTGEAEERLNSLYARSSFLPPVAIDAVETKEVDEVEVEEEPAAAAPAPAPSPPPPPACLPAFLGTHLKIFESLELPP